MGISISILFYSLIPHLCRIRILANSWYQSHLLSLPWCLDFAHCLNHFISVLSGGILPLYFAAVHFLFFFPVRPMVFDMQSIIGGQNDPCILSCKLPVHSLILLPYNICFTLCVCLWIWKNPYVGFWCVSYELLCVRPFCYEICIPAILLKDVSLVLCTMSLKNREI